jgi:hypothetical protein
MKKPRNEVAATRPAKPVRPKTLKSSPAPSPEASLSDGRRSHRVRPTPSFLLEQQDLDDIARRRCLLILSVLSGQTPVTDAIAGTDLSRQLYYQLEERALRAMLRALTPGQESVPAVGRDPQQARRIAELEGRLKELEQDKRRSERLLFLTRKVVSPGPLKSSRRGRPAKGLSSTGAGHKLLPSSKSLAPKNAGAGMDVPTPSTPTPAGGGERSSGNES